MKFFLHENSVRIINGAVDLTFTPQEFGMLELAYPALPEGMTTRYWTPERSYLSNGSQLLPLDHDCEPYVNNAPHYVASAIWAHVTLSQNRLCINRDPPDVIYFEVHLKASPDPEADDLLVNYTWNIRVRNENNLFYDAFSANFVNGFVGGVYQHQDGLPLGRYHIDEADFDRVTVGATTYAVKLVSPLEFTIYRNL